MIHQMLLFLIKYFLILILPPPRSKTKLSSSKTIHSKMYMRVLWYNHRHLLSRIKKKIWKSNSFLLYSHTERKNRTCTILLFFLLLTQLKWERMRLNRSDVTVWNLWTQNMISSRVKDLRFFFTSKMKKKQQDEKNRYFAICKWQMWREKYIYSN